MRRAFVLMLIAVPSLSHAYLNPPQTISLVPPDNNLENENQIERLCPKASPDVQKCRQEKLGPQTWVLNVFESPSAASQTPGRILITGIPGKGMNAQYEQKGQKPVPFVSDSKETDWGYSSFFEFTVSDMAGDWIQLPKRPFAHPIWINIKKDWQKKGDLDLRPTPKPLETEMVYTTGELGNIVITKFFELQFSYRKENANDMSCGEEPKKISPNDFTESVKPIEKLFDKDGHLIAWPAHTRGC